MENGVAPTIIAARSARWNSGRLPSISAIVSPLRRPSACRPAASASTRSRSSPHVHATSSSLVRTATSPARWAEVSRKASAIVAASTPRFGAVLLSTSDPSPGWLLHSEAIAPKPIDVVGETHYEEHDHQHEPDIAGLLHDPERDRAPTHLLRQRPEDMPPVERKEGEEVHDRQRQGDEREDLQRQHDVVLLEGLPRRLVGADHAGDVLAGLAVVEQPGDRADRRLGHAPHAGDRAGRGVADRQRVVVEAEGEADEHAALAAVVVDRAGVEPGADR